MKSQWRFGWALVALLFMWTSVGSVLAQDQENLGLPTNVSVQNGAPGQDNAPGQQVQDLRVAWRVCNICPVKSPCSPAA